MVQNNSDHFFTSRDFRVDQAVLPLVLFGVSHALAIILSNMISRTRGTLACDSKRSKGGKLPFLSKSGPGSLPLYLFAITVLALIQGQEK